VRASRRAQCKPRRGRQQAHAAYRHDQSHNQHRRSCPIAVHHDCTFPRTPPAASAPPPPPLRTSPPLLRRVRSFYFFLPPFLEKIERIEHPPTPGRNETTRNENQRANDVHALASLSQRATAPPNRRWRRGSRRFGTLDFRNCSFSSVGKAGEWGGGGLGPWPSARSTAGMRDHSSAEGIYLSAGPNRRACSAVAGCPVVGARLRCLSMGQPAARDEKRTAPSPHITLDCTCPRFLAYGHSPDGAAG